MNVTDRSASRRVFDTPDLPTPEVQLLSNGRYHVMITNAGSGYSRWKGLAVNRWREDPTCDNWGLFCYVRDVTSGVYWSSTHQPALKQAEFYETSFAEGKVEFRRRDLGYETHTEIAVSSADDVEVRRVHVTNRSDVRRIMEITSYSEIVLSPPATDSGHPAFNKLFIETEIIGERQAILCGRRPRAPGEPTPWMFHTSVAQGPGTREVSYETDRLQFIGRGCTTVHPQVFHASRTLTGSAGPVLDPVAAIRRRIWIESGETVTVDLMSGVGDTREACVRLLGACQVMGYAEGAIAAAPIRAQASLNKLDASVVDAELYNRLAGFIIYANAALRADPGILASNLQGQSGLWRNAISGDWPLVLFTIEDSANLDVLRQLVQAHAYWSQHGLSVDLVILCNEKNGRPSQSVAQVKQLIVAAGFADRLDKPGGVLVRRTSEIDDRDRILLQTVARIVLSNDAGSLARQIENVRAAPPSIHLLPAVRSIDRTPARELSDRSLIFRNGLGGFTPDGREYVMTVSPSQMTPAPWVNILANPSFGTLISESGSANTWSENAHEFRLTPWSNDPVSDPNTEAYYLRDEESGHFWSATLLPVAGAAPYVTRHGFGYSVFEHSEDGIDSELCVYVAIDAPVKFAVLNLRNRSGRRRRLSVTGYLEWVLGDERQKTQMHVITERDAESGALFARNAYNTEFAGRTAFFDVDEIADCSVCADRGEFLGRNGTLRNPAAMSRSRLSGAVGAALDPCAAIRVSCDWDDGQVREIVFRLGAELTVEAAGTLVRRSRGSEVAHGALSKVKDHWQHTLGAVQVKTPEPSLDILINGWLLYQTLACRVWARTAFYQSSGAFGFRDQLQDVMALVHAAPELMRAHLLYCASRQFPEGDVQHWWHPPSGRGVRTHCSDDYLWLPLATYRYVVSTGDTGVLDEPIHFLEGNTLKAGEESVYEMPRPSTEKASLYEHCARAIERALRFGVHGLPLMGSGDWNDGMNLVGAGGKGESVWLGFFLYTVLNEFSKLAQQHNDPSFSERCLSEAARLREAIERSAWDGSWYRRAWFDDGSPLGTADNAECRIDSIAQSWSVLSGAGNAERAHTAMDAVDKHLVRPEAALIQLLDPPFDKSEPNPGYIMGYLRGVRENGGQYTHAAVWAAMAFAALNDTGRAWKLLAMINPVNHGNSADAIAVYKTEPYVIASDVYALAPHIGRGGWTWYSGSAGWMYRFTLESLLGLRRAGDKLYFSPCVPADWKSYEVHYRYRETAYNITVLPNRAAGSGTTVTSDGIEQPGLAIHLIDDHLQHSVVVKVQGVLAQ